jgi:hypothetical protein
MCVILVLRLILIELSPGKNLFTVKNNNNNNNNRMSSLGSKIIVVPALGFSEI